MEYVEGGKAIGRVKIFYAGQNRNGTYISTEFAEDLLKTLAGSPIVGEYDKDKKDFTQHTGIEKTRAYGFVPLEPNIQIERYTDEDGVERDYYCADVCLFTQRYEEAKFIVGKSQSMELDPNNIDGSWSIKGGVPIFTFSKASFIGLCVLGDDMTPCFEGSSFYSKNEDTKLLMEKLRADFIANIKSSEESEGGMSMSITFNFRMSHGDIYSYLFALLNPDFNDGGGWYLSAGVIDVYDDYALVRSYDDYKYYRVSYTTNQETNDLEIGEKVEVFIIDVTAEEMQSLDTLRKANGGSFSLTDDKIATLFTEEDGETELETSEEEEGSEETPEEGASEGEFTDSEEDKEDLEEEEEETEEGETEEQEEGSEDKEFTLSAEVTAELEELREFKAKTLRNNKLAVLNSYTDVLPSEKLEELKENIDSFNTEVELEKEIAFILVKNSAFKLDTKAAVVPTYQDEDDALTKILKKYTN